MKHSDQIQYDRPIAITIAGFDPSGGAGVLGDIKTFEQLGILGMAVNTCQTIQNDCEFDGVSWVAIDTILQQIDVLFRKYKVQVVKIGLVESFPVLSNIINQIRSWSSEVLIIWDPILKASAGFSFHDQVDRDQLKDILMEIELLTPNLEEAEVLFAESSLSDYGCSILLKGGHRKEKRGTDMLYTNGETIEISGTPFVTKVQKHGTGCILSSAIVASLAVDYDLLEACKRGKIYVEKCLQSNIGNLAYHA